MKTCLDLLKEIRHIESLGENMGRPKSYDPEVIVDRAMEIFWLKGYHGTSTEDLVNHLQINRYSMYAEFGSKQDLYEEALAQYERKMVTSNFVVLESSDSGIPDIINLISAFAARARSPESKRGCMMCNAATELAPHDPNSQHFVEANVQRMSAAFSRAIKNAKRRGEVRSNVRPGEEGHYLAVTLFGFFVMLRAQIEPKVLHGAVKSTIRYLNGLKT
jgi:TetR/AcrR family transcriptional repressor of nem operon